LIKKKTSSQDKEQLQSFQQAARGKQEPDRLLEGLELLQSFQQAARGKQEPDLEGPDVFHYLKDAVLK
jgi:hypothetical protein